MSAAPASVTPEQVGRLSTRPGVYLLRDDRGGILYVGKAKNLRSRVRSYFRADAAQGIKTSELVRQVAQVETIVVGSESEALILEANLIKQHQPRFNIQLRDDKRYPYVKVTVREPFPRVYVTRRTLNDGSRYFGPFTSVGTMRQALEVIKRLYTVRSCRYDLPGDAPTRPCLDYHIGRCLAPCVGLQSQDEYRAMIEEILIILQGDSSTVRAAVEGRMRAAADQLDFEEAARHRDVLAGLDTLSREQRVQRVQGDDVDVVGLARDGELGAAVVLRFRGGSLLARDAHRFSALELDADDAAVVQSFAARTYLSAGREGQRDLPREVLVPLDFDDAETLSQVLSEAAGRRVRVRVPKRGGKRRLLDLAHQNARQVLEDRVVAQTGLDRAERPLYELQDALSLKVVPRLVACFDISHLQGTDTVGSAVVFENGEPKKSEYRRMRIRGDWGNDDYRSMHEVVARTLRRRRDEDRPIPDLIIVDGGKGQLGAALEALEELAIEDVQVAALAKREEEVYLPGLETPVRIDRRSRALHLLQRIRNEAHRFAVSYNRKLRGRRTLVSELSGIPGIGPRRQRVLLERFGSVRAIRQASVRDIARTPGFSEVLATRILTYLGR